MKEREADLEDRAIKRFKSVTPSSFVCPISKEVMEDPVILLGTGHTFERKAIEEWLSEHDTCPIDRQAKLDKKTVVPVGSLKRAISEWRSGLVTDEVGRMEGSP